MRGVRLSLLRIGLCLGIGLALGGYPGQTARAFPDEDFCTATHQDVSLPLNDLGNGVYIRMNGQNTGFTGGLYPGGSNLRPPAHEAAGIAIARQIVPLNTSGVPDPAGRIVMISVGMSNTNMEFSTFITMAMADPQVNPALFLLNGAQAGQTAEDWVDPNAPTWQEVNLRLAHYGITPQQVQVAWVKLTLIGPGAFPERAQELLADLEAIARNLKTLYPYIKIAYFSSRTRSYTYWEGLSPEPTAFETGFAVKWLIESQINGDPDLNYDPARGPVVSPYLSWSSYLWIDGLNPRSDGLTWEPQDMIPDCTHPSSYGRAKVAAQLMSFFKNDTTTGWFRGETANIFLNFLPWILRDNLPGL